jgi:hypothetical protein
MSVQKISALLSLFLITSPIALTATLDRPATNITTSSRTASRKMGALLAQAPKIEPMGIYVGELQERWQFPSDHLPIGMTLDGLHITSFNVLDADYMSWVTEKDSQGLKRSMIADEHVKINDSGLTVRDRHIVQLILQMINHPTHPRSLLSLQETNDPFLSELRANLPPLFEIISNDGNAVVVDKNRFEILEATAVVGILSGDERSFQDISLRRKDTQEVIRLINAHLPGDPMGPARYEFAQYLAQTYRAEGSTIAMGDMNFNELEMHDAMDRAFQQSPFKIYTPYCTNIGTKNGPAPLVSKAIDHFIVSSPSKVQIHSAEEVLIGLTATHQLIN